MFNHQKVSKNDKLPPGPFTIPWPQATSFYFSASPGRWSPFSANTTPSTDPSSPSASASIPSSLSPTTPWPTSPSSKTVPSLPTAHPPFLINKIISRNQHNINTAFYGPTWRLLRRNLISEILHPSRVKSYSRARKWVLDILLNRLLSQSEIRRSGHREGPFANTPCFACWSLCVSGTSLAKPRLRKSKMSTVAYFCARADQEAVLMPLIEARRKVKLERLSKAKEDKDDDDEFVVSYVDTLLDLELPEEKRKLQEGEMVTLCSEFLNAGTDTTSTTLQWIMANLVKYPHIQEKLFVEIKGVVGDRENEVKEEDLNKMPYLKAVVLEGLRRHPPAHFVLPHAVTEDVVLDGYLVPKNAALNFMVAEMGWDPKVWEDPMAFKPERFLSGGGDGGGEVFDITGSREIKMMPFGAGRRICPAHGLAMLHLEYFVANLIWNFEWRAVDGDEVDLSEKQEFTIAMKYPLKAHLSRRI
uniref:Cytochrome P450 n=1 Tax=Fagus sylvatica TaxID=28930 RepID=A0A2N9I1M7_FAGSY